MKSNIMIDTEKLENIITSLEENAAIVKQIFEELNTKLKDFDGSNEVWQGDVQSAVYQNYDAISKNFPSIVEQLNDYNIFLRKTVNNYKKEEKNIDTSIDNNKENLDVN